MSERQWYNVELLKELADRFRVYLKQIGIKFEPSEAYNLIHFECYMNEKELAAANTWLQSALK